MSTDTAAFIATTKEDVSRCMTIAQQALQDRRPATVGDMLEALKIVAARVEAYRAAKSDSATALSKLLEDIVLAQSTLAKELRAWFKPMGPKDLPAGVTTRSMAHPEGPCYAFHHDVLGELGRIVLIPAGMAHIELRAEIHEESRGKADNENLFREVINSVRQSLKQLNPSESP